jgi:hypothetical protein
MMTAVTVTLPFKRATPGALLYALPDMKNTIVSSVYVRKDKLRAAGFEGDWPAEITVTVQVADPVKA